MGVLAPAARYADLSAAGVRRRRTPHPAVRLSLAVGGGVLLALAFPPLGWGWLVLPGVAALTLACRGARLRFAALAGFCQGVAFFAVLLTWLQVIGWDAWVALPVAEAFFFAALGVGIALVTRWPAWPVTVALLWVAQEWARDRVPLGGFPWGRLGYASVGTPVERYASLAGVPLVTLVVALIANLALWAVLRRRRFGFRVVAGGAAAALVAVGAVVPISTAADRTVNVGVVQGDVPGRGLTPLGRARTVTDNHVAGTRQLAADVAAGRVAAPDFVLWPENSTDIDPFVDPITYRDIEAAVHAVGVPILVGAMVDGPGPTHVRNEGIVWSPTTGPGARYIKRHPVPFGEYVPFRSVLTKFIGALALIPRDMVAGTKPGVLPIGGVRIGDVICFEVAYDGIVADVVQHGAQLLVVQTNNATYQGTAQPAQQWDITRLDAVATGRTAIVASTTGISGVIRPDGSVVRQTGQSVRAEFVQRVPLRTSVTLAMRLGATPEWVLALLGIAVAAAAGIATRGRSGGSPRDRQAGRR